jgi:hypothetical protein
MPKPAQNRLGITMFEQMQTAREGIGRQGSTSLLHGFQNGADALGCVGKIQNAQCIGSVQIQQPDAPIRLRPSRLPPVSPGEADDVGFLPQLTPQRERHPSCAKNTRGWWCGFALPLPPLLRSRASVLRPRFLLTRERTRHRHSTRSATGLAVPMTHSLMCLGFAHFAPVRRPGRRVACGVERWLHLPALP